MTTTFVNFAPTATTPFQFTATLDGVLYTILVTWNLFGQRWYINIIDQSNNLVACLPLLGSPTPLPLAPPPAAEDVLTMTWNSTDGGRVYFVMTDPSDVVLGELINVSGATNTGTAGDGAVNGDFLVDQWTDSQHFAALLTAPAGAVGIIGGVIIINLQAASLTWNMGIVTVTTQDPVTPLLLQLGSVVRVSILGATPDGYNGSFLAVVTGPSEMRYQLATDPGGPSTVAGNFSLDVNMAAGYFETSTLVFRDDSQQFEISP